MEKQDARSLSADAMTDLRKRVVRAVRNGMSQTEAAEVFGVCRYSVNKWVGRSEKEGIRSLKSKAKGRPKQSRLTTKQSSAIIRMITDHCPDQLKLPFALWTRAAVQDLIRKKCIIDISVWTVGRYLKEWGMTPQKPIRRAFEQNPKAVRHWLKKEYPTIRKAAKAEGAIIHWGDEMGMRSDHQTGTSYGLKGQTPVILGTGQRFRCNIISTVTNRGELAFMVFKYRFTAPVFITFLRRLIRHSEQTVFLILDQHPAHKAARVRSWVKKNEKKIRIYFLPSYSPELNPDELLNQDVKSNALGRQRPRDREEMIAMARSYLRSTQRQPEIVSNYFHEEHVRYAAC